MNLSMTHEPLIFNANPRRIESLDVIRGFALLGILIMNIQSFSMPSAAYFNPSAFGDLQGTNFYTWLVSHLLADMKMMNIFSMLFGAGLLVFCGRAEQKGQSAAGLHYRRNFWLLIFGLVHAHLIWFGDILYPYAMCAFIAFWFRHFSALKLMLTGLLFLAIGSGYFLLIGIFMPYFPAEAIAEISNAWQPDAARLSKEINAYQGGLIEQFLFRHKEATMMQTQAFFSVFIWRIMGMMCLGMALFKWDILSAAKDAYFYRKLASVCLISGVAIVGYGAYQNIQHEFALSFSFFLGSQFNYWGSILVSVGYIALLCLWVQSSKLEWLKIALGKVGKMAFSHYIFHSLAFTYIFYGHGLGLFAEVDRATTLWMVVAMWIFQLGVSSWWLQHFKYGPLEWLWRSLTYKRFQPMRLPGAA
jgi:uncharacterized protein